MILLLDDFGIVIISSLLVLCNLNTKLKSVLFTIFIAFSNSIYVCVNYIHFVNFINKFDFYYRYYYSVIMSSSVIYFLRDINLDYYLVGAYPNTNTNSSL